MFWKTLAVAAVIGLFVIGSGLHRTTETADAQEKKPEVRKLKWQHVKSDGGFYELQRARVPGGWLVGFYHHKEARFAGCGGLTFVPDQRGLWRNYSK